MSGHIADIAKPAFMTLSGHAGATDSFCDEVRDMARCLNSAM
jgi:hypothetical protein